MVEILWVIGILLVIPQGIVSLAIHLGGGVRSWQLPLYLPEPYIIPAAVGMIILGLCAIGLAESIRRKKKS